MMLLTLVPVATTMSVLSAQEPMMRTISVEGEGTASGPPDMATIYTGVVTQAATANEALAANNGAMNKIMDVLKKQRIADKDVQTSSFNIQPEYERDPRGRTTPEVVGYRVTNQVQVHVRNLPELGKTLDALVQAGSNSVSGISFGMNDATGLLNEARGKAVTDARSRAKLYAQAAGVSVGKVLSISEQRLEIPRPQFMARSFAAADASSVPVATGEHEVRASINIMFALTD
jgi:uncharacterized protein YggE